MKKLKGNFVFLLFALLGSVAFAAGEFGSVPNEKLLFTCLVNRNVVLNIYRVEALDGVDVVLEREYIVAGATPDRMVLHRPEMVHNSRVFIVLQNQGERGYFLLRAERGVAPISTEMGDSSVLMENNLFEATGTAFHTLGHLKSLPNCSAVH